MAEPMQGRKPDRRLLIQFFVLGVVAAATMASYAVARPASESLFLSVFGTERLPYAWFAVAVGAFCTVSWYNRYANSRPLITLFQQSCVIISIILSLLVWLLWQGTHENNGQVLAHSSAGYVGVFLLYVWKDIYIVVLVEIFWSLANLVFPVRIARWTYGLFLIMGAVGGISGALGVGILAQAFGTTLSILAVIPLLGLGVLGSAWLARQAEGQIPMPPQQHLSSFSEGFLVVRRNSYLLLMAALII